MNAPLPTREQLEKLPLRAVVTYAARNARRLSSTLRGIVPDDTLDDALNLLDAVSKAPFTEIEPASVVRAGERVAAAYEAAPDSIKSVDKFRMVFPLVQATLAAMNGVLGALYPSDAREWLRMAAQAATRGVQPIEKLNREAALAATMAARRDYEVLLRRYGESDEVVIGDPLDCFDDERRS